MSHGLHIMIVDGEESRLMSHLGKPLAKCDSIAAKTIKIKITVQKTHETHNDENVDKKRKAEEYIHFFQHQPISSQCELR